MTERTKTVLGASKSSLWPQLVARIIFVISGVAFLLFITFSLIYFPRTTASTQLHNLGLYGDFVGGILGTIFGFASLGVTIYLAMILHRIERENISSSIAAQREIALMQLKCEEVIVLKTVCDRAMEQWGSCLRIPNSILEVRDLIVGAVDRIKILFPELNDISDYKTISLFRDLDEYIMQALPLAEDLERMFRNNPEFDEKFNEGYQNWTMARESLWRLLKHLGEWARK